MNPPKPHFQQQTWPFYISGNFVHTDNKLAKLRILRLSKWCFFECCEHIVFRYVTQSTSEDNYAVDKLLNHYMPFKNGPILLPIFSEILIIDYRKIFEIISTGLLHKFRGIASHPLKNITPRI